MKVVLFCGGMGTRLREYSDDLPKPLVPIGYRPIIWHLMRYYAHFGHKDFILCLGYKAQKIKEYFLNHNPYIANDFTLAKGKPQIGLQDTDVPDWNITFVDTGLKANVGMRLMQVKKYLEGEEMFLANYTDCLTDMHLPTFIQQFCARGKVAGFVTVAPQVTFHYVAANDGIVTKLTDVRSTSLRVNGGFFAFRQGIFDYVRNNEELVDGPFHRLIEKSELYAYEHEGFWKAMDTFKDKQQMDELVRTESPPWALWLGAPAAPAAAVTVGAAGVMRRRRRLRVRPGSMVSPLRRRSSDLPEDSP
jgi:glucose-1-phosphate cytidylyltransferase